MAKCPTCGAEVDEAAVKATTSQTAFGAQEVDPSKGTRQFHEGAWYYFDRLECRTRFMSQQGAAKR